MEFDHRQLTAQVMADRLAYQLELAGAGASTPTPGDPSWATLVDQLEHSIRALGRPLCLGIHRMDELPPGATQALIRAAGTVPGLRLVATAVDADFLATQAVAAGVGHRVVSDPELAYTPDEVAELLAAELPGATEATVRAVMEATGGLPVLVERAISLFGPECLAGTINDEQALSGWVPERQGAPAFRSQLRELAQALRFSYEFLVCRFGAERAEYLYSRLTRLGVGAASQPLNGRRMFTWRPAMRRHLLQVWHSDSPPSLVGQDRARIAECALASDDPELAVAMLVANRSLAEAERLCAQWLWELTDADAGLLGEHFTVLDPAELRSYPNLLVVDTLIQPMRGEASGDAELSCVQRALLGEQIAGSVPVQLGRLAKAATLALAIGELGVATRAAVRWAHLALSKPHDWAEGVGAEGVSDGLLVIRALLQLDRIDLVSELARILMASLRRNTGRAGGSAGEARLAELLAALRLVAALQGTPRAEVRSLNSAPRQYYREFDIAIYASLDACEALDRGDLASAEAFTRVAMFRLPHPADWPTLIFLRVVALIGLGDQPKLDELADQLLSTQRWESWQHHPEALGMFAALIESMMVSATARFQRSPAEQGAQIRSLPPGASHRWPQWGRRVFEIGFATTASLRGPVVPSDAELEVLSPRVRWQLGLVAALANLRMGEEATAISVAIRGGMRLRYPAAPLPLVLASAEEIAVLNDRLPSNAPPLVRTSLALAKTYAGLAVGGREALRFAARELEVLDGVRRGLTNTAIARELFVSVNTVKFHRANLYRKLSATSREELLAQALQQGI